MQRGQFLSLAAGTAIACGQPAHAAAGGVLRVVPHADLKVLDPVAVSIVITRMHGTMIYESLFAWDSRLAPKPMMVSDYDISSDGRTYRFRLRDSLRFHDGRAVDCADVVASLQRWMKRDLVGRKLSDRITVLSAREPDVVEMVLDRPYGFVEFSLGSAIGQIPVIMRRQDAELDPSKPNTTAVGSGPFRFVADQWVPGARIVYGRNDAYRPRDEPVDGLAGRREVMVERVEWTVMPDAATAAAALQNGEIDYWDRVPADLMPLLKRNRQIRTGSLGSLPNVAMLRANNLLPPFNDVRARQALALALDQTEFMQAVTGDNVPWGTCDNYFVCGSANATAPSDARPVDLAKARALLAETGYKGGRVVLASSPDIPAIGQIAHVAEQRLKAIGLNVGLQMYDWGTANTRILSQAPVAEGGWNLYCTFFSGETQFSPLTNVATNTACNRSDWVGWPCDQGAADLRQAFLDASTDATRHDALTQLQQRLLEVQPCRILGQFEQASAWRSNITAPRPAAVAVFWNIAKT